MTEVAIRTENLTRDFDTVRAVDGLSLEVPNYDSIVINFTIIEHGGKLVIGEQYLVKPQVNKVGLGVSVAPGPTTFVQGGLSK